MVCFPFVYCEFDCKMVTFATLSVFLSRIWDKFPFSTEAFPTKFTLNELFIKKTRQYTCFNKLVNNISWLLLYNFNAALAISLFLQMETALSNVISYVDKRHIPKMIQYQTDL